jgi:hypothetical protein
MKEFFERRIGQTIPGMGLIAYVDDHHAWNDDGDCFPFDCD